MCNFTSFVDVSFSGYHSRRVTDIDGRGSGVSVSCWISAISMETEVKMASASISISVCVFVCLYVCSVARFVDVVGVLLQFCFCSRVRSCFLLDPGDFNGDGTTNTGSSLNIRWCFVFWVSLLIW